MKYIYLVFLAFFSFEVFAGNCTTTTRTNFTTGQVLTSTALNADFNQLVSKVNSLDGGCVTDGTLEAAALNSTDFATLLNGIHQGCPLGLVDTNTVSVGKCIISLAGNLVKTTTNTNVTWGCSGCASELSSTLYYVYARPTSTGTTLNLLISTTAPGDDGLDATAGKVLGRFYNNSSSAITLGTVESWTSNRFQGATEFNSTVTYSETDATTKCSTPSTNCLVANTDAITVGVRRSPSTGVYDVQFSRPVKTASCTGSAKTGLSTGTATVLFTDQSWPATSAQFATYSSVSPYALTDTLGSITCKGFY